MGRLRAVPVAVVDPLSAFGHALPRSWARRSVCTLVALATVWAIDGRAVEDRRNWFDTPFERAVAGLAGCPRPAGPLLTVEEMRQQAHGRIERGTSCWLAKKCDDSNVYRRDPEIQARVLQAIRSEPRVQQSSIWVTTERRYVTLQGCVAAAGVGGALVERVRRVEGVEGVFD